MLCFSLMLETQIHKVFCDACLAPSPPSTAQGKQNTSDRFCLIVKRVNCTGLDVGICCKPEHQDLIVSIHLAGGGMPQKDLMLLVSFLSWEE